MAERRYASWIATTRSQAKTVSRSGCARSRIAQAVWQASSISSRGALHGARDRAVELAVVAAVELVFVAAWLAGVGCRSGAA